jgi:hypothetical protein
VERDLPRGTRQSLEGKPTREGAGRAAHGVGARRGIAPSIRGVVEVTASPAVRARRHTTRRNGFAHTYRSNIVCYATERSIGDNLGASATDSRAQDSQQRSADRIDTKPRGGFCTPRPYGADINEHLTWECSPSSYPEGTRRPRPPVDRRSVRNRGKDTARTCAPGWPWSARPGGVARVTNDVDSAMAGTDGRPWVQKLPSAPRSTALAKQRAIRAQDEGVGALGNANHQPSATREALDTGRHGSLHPTELPGRPVREVSRREIRAGSPRCGPRASLSVEAR